MPAFSFMPFLSIHVGLAESLKGVRHKLLPSPPFLTPVVHMEEQLTYLAKVLLLPRSFQHYLPITITPSLVSPFRSHPSFYIVIIICPLCWNFLFTSVFPSLHWISSRWAHYLFNLRISKHFLNVCWMNKLQFTREDMKAGKPDRRLTELFGQEYMRD